LPGKYSIPGGPAPVQSYGPAKKNKPAAAKPNKPSGPDFPGLPAPSAKTVFTTRSASGPSYRPPTAPQPAAISQTYRSVKKSSTQPSSKPSKQRVFDPFDDDSDVDFPSYGGGAPAGLDSSSARAVRASGQGMDYTSREHTSNIKTVDKSILEALQGARISESSAPRKKVIVTSKEEFPGLGASGGGGAAGNKKNKKANKPKGKEGLGCIASILGGAEQTKPVKPRDRLEPRPNPSLSPTKTMGFAESLARPSKQKPTSNKKQEKAAAIPTSEDFPTFDLKGRGPGMAFIRAEDKLIQPKPTQSQWNKKVDLHQQKESNGNVRESWEDAEDDGSSPPRNLSPTKNKPLQQLKQNQTYVFATPDDFQERNSALISTVSDILGGISLEFKMFREMSG
jgi:hypothetical protein